MLEMQCLSQEVGQSEGRDIKNGGDPRALPQKEIVKYNKSLRDSRRIIYLGLMTGQK